MVSGDIPKQRAAVIGAGVKSPEDQRALVDLLDSREKNGKRLTNDQVGEMIRLTNEAPKTTDTQESLFGTQEMTRSLIPEKAEVSEYIQRRMQQEKKLFAAVGNESAAARLGQTGNVINAGENAQVAERTGQAHALYQKLSTVTGPVNDALDVAASKIAKGDNSTSVREEAYQHIKAALLEQAQGLAGTGEAPVERSEVNAPVEANPARAGELDRQPAAAQSKSPEINAARMLATVRELEPTSGVPVSTLRLRKALPDLSKEDFDAAALELSKQQKAFLSLHPDPFNITAEDQRMLIKGPYQANAADLDPAYAKVTDGSPAKKNSYYVGVAERPPETVPKQAEVVDTRTALEAQLAQLREQNQKLKAAPNPRVEAARAEVGARTAKRFRIGADALQNQIDAKRNPAISHQNLTARRGRIAEGMGRDADRIEWAQKRLRALADMHESGTVPESLKGIASRADLEELRPGFDDRPPEYRHRDAKRLEVAGITSRNFDEAAKAVAGMGTKREKTPAEVTRELERGLIGRKIEGFFPTPRPVVDRMLSEADVRPGMKVLEPSAGKGDIADAARDKGADVTAVELHPELRSILDAKGHEVGGFDFLSYRAGLGQYDRVVMNPPFERGQDIEHVRHAFEMLKPGGRLVSLMGEGSFFKQDANSVHFRDWLDNVHGTSEKLDPGSFTGKDSFRQTGVAARMVVVDKPATSVKRNPGERGSFSNQPVPDENLSIFGREADQRDAEESDRNKLEADRLTAQLRAPITRDEQMKKLKRDKTKRQADMFAEPEEEDRQGGLSVRSRARWTLPT